MSLKEGNSFEVLNNAITLACRAGLAARDDGKMDEQRLQSVLRLQAHWERYVWSQPWRTIAPTQQDQVLAAYVRWYTRAWSLLPEPYRERAPKPTDIEPNLAADEIKRIAEGMQATWIESADLARKAAKASKDALAAVGTPIFWGLLALGAFWIWTRRK